MFGWNKWRRAVNCALASITERMAQMAKKDELDQKLQALDAAVKDAAGRIAQKLADLEAKLTAATTGVDLTAEVSAVQAEIDALGALGTDPAPPAPAPAPDPAPAPAPDPAPAQ